MALGPGSKLGVYEVTAKIGAGGMGEVYRAHDTTLDRDVAIKVLPDAFATDPERLARFEREAKVLASLNHPNIAAIYGLEKSGDTRALILELVEGPHAPRSYRQRPDPTRRSPAHRPPDRRGPGSGARAGDHSPRPEAGQREGQGRRHGEGAGLRPGEGAPTGTVRPRRRELTHDDDDGSRDKDRLGRLHRGPAARHPPGTPP